MLLFNSYVFVRKKLDPQRLTLSLDPRTPCKKKQNMADPKQTAHKEIRTPKQNHTHTYTYMYIYIYTHVYVCTYIYVLIHIYICICIYICPGQISTPKEEPILHGRLPSLGALRSRPSSPPKAGGDQTFEGGSLRAQSIQIGVEKGIQIVVSRISNPKAVRIHV